LGECTERSGEIHCKAILLDYNGFELHPRRLPAGIRPEVDHRGFIMVNPLMQTNLPGVFAAGDITGRYASVMTALADGVTAGFEAYRYVYAHKFGTEPCLFAYSAREGAVHPGEEDYPPLPDDAFPVLLVSPNRVIEAINELSKNDQSLAGLQSEALVEAIDGRTSLAAISGRFDLDSKRLEVLFDLLMEEKLATLHINQERPNQ